MEQLLLKVNEALKEFFVGNYCFSDIELEDIYNHTNKLLRDYECSRGNSVSEKYDELVFVAMVNAAKVWKTDEDRFWDCIYKKLSGAQGSQKLYSYLTS